MNENLHSHFSASSFIISMEREVALRIDTED